MGVSRAVFPSEYQRSQHMYIFSLGCIAKGKILNIIEIFFNKMRENKFDWRRSHGRFDYDFDQPLIDGWRDRSECARQFGIVLEIAQKIILPGSDCLAFTNLRPVRLNQELYFYSVKATLVGWLCSSNKLYVHSIRVRVKAELSQKKGKEMGDISISSWVRTPPTVYFFR